MTLSALGKSLFMQALFIEVQRKADPSITRREIADAINRVETGHPEPYLLAPVQYPIEKMEIDRDARIYNLPRSAFEQKRTHPVRVTKQQRRGK